MSDIRNKTNSQQSAKASLFWKFLERGSVQVVQFVVGIVIARLLEPSQYGEVALLMIFVSIATVFVQSGLSTALIQKKVIDKTEVSSVFWYSIIVALICYLLLFYSAKYIALFYKMSQIEQYLKVMALTLFPGAFNSVQIAILSREMLFRKQFYCGLIAAIVSGIMGITFAHFNYGAWALIVQQLSYQTVICMMLLLMLKWLPSFSFSLRRTKPLLNFGYKLLVSGLIDTIYHNLESLVIGRFFSASSLAYCNKGKMFPLVVVSNIDGSIQSVMLPVFSRNQDSVDHLKKVLRKTISLSCFCVFPIMILMATCSTSMIGWLLGEKWLDSSIFVILFCYITMLFPLQTANIQALNALGKSDLTMNYMILKRIIGVLLLFSFLYLFKTPVGIVLSCLFTEIVGVAILIPYNKIYLNYGTSEMLKDIASPLIYSFLMFLLVYPVKVLGFDYWITCLMQLFLGGGIYISIALLLGNDNIKQVIDMVRNKKTR